MGRCALLYSLSMHKYSQESIALNFSLTRGCRVPLIGLQSHRWGHAFLIHHSLGRYMDVAATLHSARENQVPVGTELTVGIWNHQLCHMQNLLVFQRSELQGFSESVNKPGSLLHELRENNQREPVVKEVFGKKHGPQKQETPWRGSHGKHWESTLPAVVFLTTVLEKQGCLYVPWKECTIETFQSLLVKTGSQVPGPGERW